MERRIGQALLLLMISSTAFAQFPEPTSPEADSLIKHLNDPFTFLSLQIRDSKKVVLQWVVKQGLLSDYFSIEKNVDGKNYEPIGAIKSIQGASKYEFTDEIPTRGNSLYRIRMTMKGGGSFVSDSVDAYIPGSALISFYPNPVDNVLIIRSSFTGDVLISDGMGKARIARNIGVGPSIIDVSTLEKGVYLLRITDKITNQQQVEKIMKN
jgi:hypothetical protein